MESQTDRALELSETLKSSVISARNIDPSGPVNPADAYACYRILLGRQPSDSEIDHFLWLATTDVSYREFLSGLLNSSEYSQRSLFMPPRHMLMAELDRFRFWFRTEDREMGVCMGLRQYEPEVVAMLPKLISTGETCLDIGAQTGFFTMHLASLVGSTGTVHSFEPMTESFSVLSRNIAENNFGEIVRAMQVACSSENGEIRFSEHSGMLVASRTGEGVGIKTVKADDFGDGRISFVKLDVEGHEMSVLEGMTRILSNERPVILSEVNEYWLQEAGTSGREYLLELAAHAYTPIRIETLESIDPSTLELGRLDSINILAIPNERIDEVRRRLR